MGVYVIIVAYFAALTVCALHFGLTSYATCLVLHSIRSKNAHFDQIAKREEEVRTSLIGNVILSVDVPLTFIDAQGIFNRITNTYGRLFVTLIFASSIALVWNAHSVEVVTGLDKVYRTLYEPLIDPVKQLLNIARLGYDTFIGILNMAGQLYAGSRQSVSVVVADCGSDLVSDVMLALPQPIIKTIIAMIGFIEGSGTEPLDIEPVISSLRNIGVLVRNVTTCSCSVITEPLVAATAFLDSGDTDVAVSEALNVMVSLFVNTPLETAQVRQKGRRQKSSPHLFVLLL